MNLNIDCSDMNELIALLQYLAQSGIEASITINFGRAGAIPPERSQSIRPIDTIISTDNPTPPIRSDAPAGRITITEDGEHLKRAQKCNAEMAQRYTLMKAALKQESKFGG